MFQKTFFGICPGNRFTSLCFWETLVTRNIASVTFGVIFDIERHKTEELSLLNLSVRNSIFQMKALVTFNLRFVGNLIHARFYL